MAGLLSNENDDGMYNNSDMLVSSMGYKCLFVLRYVTPEHDTMLVGSRAKTSDRLRSPIHHPPPTETQMLMLLESVLSAPQQPLQELQQPSSSRQ